jgi:hypothetical protein
MGRSRHLFLIVPALFVYQFVSPVSGQTIKKEVTTSGNNSPAYMAGRDINIYGVSEKEMEALKQACTNLNSENASLKKEAEEYKKKLIQIYETKYNALPSDASSWATYFMSTLSSKKDELGALEKAKKDLSSKVKAKLPSFFSYIIGNFDSKTVALQKYMETIELKKITTIDYNMLFGLSQNAPVTVREVKLPNQRVIAVVLRPGRIANDLVTAYPSLNFVVMDNNPGTTFFFISGEERKPLVPRPGTISHLSNSLTRDYYYAVDDEVLITDQFDAEFADKINKLYDFALLGRYKGR